MDLIWYVFRKTVNFYVLSFSICSTCIFFLLQCFVLNNFFNFFNKLCFYRHKKAECRCLADASVTKRIKNVLLLSINFPYSLIVGFFILWDFYIIVFKGILKRAEPCKCVILLISRRLWHKRITPSLKE